jgi:hypothetical protein
VEEGEAVAVEVGVEVTAGVGEGLAVGVGAEVGVGLGFGEDVGVGFTVGVGLAVDVGVVVGLDEGLLLPVNKSSSWMVPVEPTSKWSSVRTVPVGIGPKVIVAEVHALVVERVGPEKKFISLPDELLQKT